MDFIYLKFHGRSLEITLGIKVIGENDTEGPVFVQKEFTRYASEGTQVGSVIAEIKVNL